MRRHRLALAASQAEDASTPPVQENRSSGRRTLYLGEGMRVRLRQDETHKWLPGEAYCLSPEGMGVALDVGVPTPALVVGDSVEVDCEIPGYPSFRFQARVANGAPARLSQRDVFRIGLTYTKQMTAERPDAANCRRKSIRVACPPFFHPLAYCEHPLFFKEHIHFQVNAVTSSGLELVTSARNKAFVPGMPLRLTVLIPMQGEFQAEVVVRNVRLANPAGDRYYVGVHFTRTMSGLRPALSEFLAAFTTVTLQQLRESNFDVDRVEKALAFGYVVTQEDWNDVLALRFAAYKAAGKFSSAKTPADMEDKYDRYARHLVCRQRGKVIAAMRIVFVNGDLERSEHHNLKLPIPKFLGTHFVELSRACTNPEYRGSDLFINMLRHCARIVTQAGVRYMLMNCNDNMWPLYQKAGCQKAGITFDAFGTRNCHLIYADVERLVRGFGGGFFGYHYVSYPMAKYLNARKDKVSPITKLKLYTHDKADPVAMRIIKARKKTSSRAR